MKKILILLALFSPVFSFLSKAQEYETVVLNYEKSYFGENKALPAEKYFIITAPVSQNIPYIEVEIYDGNHKKAAKPNYTATWKRMDGMTVPTFNIPINYRLRQNNDYDIYFKFYRPLIDDERAQLKTDLYNALDAYIDGTFQMQRKGLKLTRNTKQIISDLDKIVTKGISYNRSRIMGGFTGFSDLIKVKIKQIDDAKTKSFMLFKKEDESKNEVRSNFRDQLLGELKTLVHSEVEQYLNTDLYLLADDKLVAKYPTEKTKSIISANIGYGGVMFNTDFKSDFNYGSNLYAGLSFPLGRQSMSPFWNKTSLSIGAFIGNLKDRNKQELSGPIFKVPTYIALGYRPLRFIRINAGAAFLENPSTAGGSIQGLENRVNIRPFIGVSAELQFWMDFAK